MEPIIKQIQQRKGKALLGKVKGHSGIIGNEEVDWLAAQGTDAAAAPATMYTVSGTCG